MDIFKKLEEFQAKETLIDYIRNLPEDAQIAIVMRHPHETNLDKVQYFYSWMGPNMGQETILWLVTTFQDYILGRQHD